MTTFTDQDPTLAPSDISAEKWREYEWIADGVARTYRIEAPKSLYRGLTTHRVVDDLDTVHLVPAPGHFGCVIRWAPKDPAKPVQF